MAARGPGRRRPPGRPGRAACRGPPDGGGMPAPPHRTRRHAGRDRARCATARGTKASRRWPSGAVSSRTGLRAGRRRARARACAQLRGVTSRPSSSWPSSSITYRCVCRLDWSQRVRAAPAGRRISGSTAAASSMKRGRRAGVELGVGAALARLVAQPEDAADADRGRHLGQQDRQEELPEQRGPCAQSRISW